MKAKCWAYNDDSFICGRPAEYVDKQRGCYVCEVHKPLNNEERKGNE